jgi:hypothetical protein
MFPDLPSDALRSARLANIDPQDMPSIDGPRTDQPMTMPTNQEIMQDFHGDTTADRAP